MIAVDRLSFRRARGDRLLVRRAVLSALGLLVVLAVSRTVLFPPSSRVIERVPVGQSQPQAAAAAQDFASAWLSVDSTDPQRRNKALQRFGDPQQWQVSLPTNRVVRRAVTATQIAQVADRGDGSSVYVVQADMSRGPGVYLAVRVAIDAGELQIIGSPALVGPPALKAAVESPRELGDVVEDPALQEVVGRGLRNLLAERTDDLRADLTPTAAVSTLPGQLELREVEQVAWTLRGRSVLARLLATDSRGVTARLDYELDVEQQPGGRWFIAAIHVPAQIKPQP